MPTYEPPKTYAEALERLEKAESQVLDLLSRVNYLIDWMGERNILKDDKFTFPDGSVWTVDEYKKND